MGDRAAVAAGGDDGGGAGARGTWLMAGPRHSGPCRGGADGGVDNATYWTRVVWWPRRSCGMGDRADEGGDGGVVFN